MEKFGIFELLDALSALASAGETAPPAEDGENAPARREPDASFAPPAYGETAQTPPSSTRTALGAFLERHERTKERAKK